MKEIKLYAQRNARVNEEDRLALASLLVKFGYTVRLGKITRDKPKAAILFVGAKGDEDDVSL